MSDVREGDSLLRREEADLRSGRRHLRRAAAVFLVGVVVAEVQAVFRHGFKLISNFTNESIRISISNRRSKQVGQW